jgi:hypothetical protein
MQLQLVLQKLTGSADNYLSGGSIGIQFGMTMEMEYAGGENGLAGATVKLDQVRQIIGVDDSITTTNATGIIFSSIYLLEFTRFLRFLQ